MIYIFLVYFTRLEDRYLCLDEAALVRCLHFSVPPQNLVLGPALLYAIYAFCLVIVTCNDPENSDLSC